MEPKFNKDIELTTEGNDIRAKVPSNLKYLSDVISEIPSGYIINKGATGCGGTTMELKSNRDSIIVMPFINVIKNKEGQIVLTTDREGTKLSIEEQEEFLNEGEELYSKIDGFYGDIEILSVYGYRSVKSINKFLKSDSGSYKKILVTYDSFYKLLEFINPKDWFVLVDEWHLTFNSYHFRRKGLNSLFESLRDCPNVAYLTATPIEKQYRFGDIRELPEINITWDAIITTKINTVSCRSYIAETVKLVNEFSKVGVVPNAHIFINSVSDILTIIKKCNYSSDNMRVVCADKEHNRLRLSEVDLDISDTNDSVQKINFYTATAFEGCDIYDPEGQTVVVSSSTGYRDMATDVFTTLIQIIGRLRNSRYNDSVKLIIQQKTEKLALETKDLRLLEEGFRQKAECIKTNIDCYNELPASYRDYTDYSGVIDVYDFDKVNRIATYNEGKLLTQLYSFSLVHQILTNEKNLQLTLDNMQLVNGIKLHCEFSEYASDVIAKKGTKARVKFSDLFTEYAALRTNKMVDTLGTLNRIAILEQKNPLVKEAYDKLGVESVKKSGYRVDNIKSKLKRLKMNNTVDIKSIVYKEFKLGEFYSNERLRSTVEHINKIYGTNITGRPSAFLKEYFVMTKKQSSVGGKNKHGYLLTL